MERFKERQAIANWAQQESAALARADLVAYRMFAVNHRVAQTIAVANSEGWYSWKERSVCKYMTKTFENMAIAELSAISDQAVHELIAHASEGFDSHARRRAGRQ